MRVAQLLGIGGFFSRRYDFSKWKDLLTLDFQMSHLCCNEMKKKPFHKYPKKMLVATLAEESQLRQTAWLKTGCNAFDKGLSKPMSFWTEQDVLHYIKQNNLPIASVYGEIVYGTRNGAQYNNTLFDMLYSDTFSKIPASLADCAFGTTKTPLCTTGCERTGCFACGFGAHREKGEGRFVALKRTHPRLYNYCMDGGAYDTDGFWKPTKNGLGYWHCIDELNRLYGKDFIKY